MDLSGVKVGLYKRLPRTWQVKAVRLGTPNFTVGSLGLITYDGAQLLLVRQSYRHGWSPPGGLLERGETAVEAVTREVEEEIGLRVLFREPHRSSLDVDRQSVSFLSVGVVTAAAEFAPRGAEILEARWFAVDNLPPMPRDYSEGLPPEDLVALRRAAALD